MELVIKITEWQKKFIDEIVVNGECDEMLHPVTVDDVLKEIKDGTPLPKGQWVDGNGICPCCGKDKYEGLDADIWSDWQPRFCPNCGAKMEPSERRLLLLNKGESEVNE